jgi:hypothetical protein
MDYRFGPYDTCLLAFLVVNRYSHNLFTFYNQGCTILSGDVIIQHLAVQLKPEYVVFLVSGPQNISFSCLHFLFVCFSSICGFSFIVWVNLNQWLVKD